MPPSNFRVRILVSALVACGGLFVTGGASADSGDLAVAYQVDVAHSGVQMDSQLVPPFSRRWRATFPAQVSYPLIADGKVFITVGSTSNDATRTPRLYALDQASGQILWSQTLPLYWPRANAAYDRGRIFVAGNNLTLGGNGVMLAYAADSGSLLWRSELPYQWSFTSAPTAANGVVYTAGAGFGGTLYAVSETDGQLLAMQSVENGDQSSPALSNDAVFVSYACNQAYGFAQTSLAPLWHYSGPCEGGGGKTVVYAGGRVYTRDFLGSLVLDASSGALLRTYEPERAYIYAPAIDSTSLFATFPGQSLHAEALDGTPLWTFTGDGQLNTTPLLLNSGSGRFVVVGSWLGRLYALNAETGGEVWSTDVGAPVSGADEQNGSEPLAGLAAGQGLLVVPAANTLSAYAADHTPPTLSLPPPVAAQASSQKGGTVSFAVAASDPDDSATVSCAPSSGSTFPIGITSVACIATDTAGNTASGNFFVVVSAPSADCDLTHYPLTKTGPNLKNAMLSGCYLPNANLVGANATAANLSGAYLAGANLSSANLSQANLRGALLKDANLTGVKWSQTTCPDATLSGDNGGTCLGHLAYS
jgi:outer membrane protein assembly factor BamB